MVMPPKRRWFQLHLSTVIMMVLLAITLWWLNIHYTNLGTITKGEWDYTYDRGWPLYSLARNKNIMENTGFTGLENLAINAVILIGTVFFCERIARRRDPKQQCIPSDAGDEPETPEKPRRWRLQFSLRTLMLVVLAYGLCWTLTVKLGVPDVEQWLVAAFQKKFPDSQRLTYDPFTTVNDQPHKPLKMPWHYVLVEPRGPLIIKFRTGIMEGRLCGGGTSGYVLWLFGARFVVWEQGDWNS